jgi:YD repeat-containing protein
MKCKHIVLLVSLLCTLNVYSQAPQRDLFPTPNAAALGMYGQIPVTLFSGLPGIDIPIYEFKSRDLILPLHLSYHAGNIKPSTIPTWTGLGWNLQVGGAISRIQNDWCDEFINYQYYSGDSWKIKQGFFFNPGRLNTSTWSGNAALVAEADTLFGSQRAYINLRKDLAPDEFRFDFLGMSGSFFMGSDGNWKLQCREGIDLSIAFHMDTTSIMEPNSRYPSKLKNSIVDFVITGPDGTQYTFGKSANAIEYNRQGVGGADASQRDGGTVASSWFLTNIKSMTGDEINLQYVRSGYQVIVNSASYGTDFKVQTNTIAISPLASTTVVPVSDQVSVVDPVYLSKITGADGSIEFNKTAVNIMDYTMQGDPFNSNWNTLKDAYVFEVFGQDIPIKSAMFQLDSIVFKDNDNIVQRRFNFFYTSSTTNRLFLDSVKMVGLGNKQSGTYKFNYYNTANLNNVPYSTLKVDHWGFFTNVNPVLDLFAPIPSSPGTVYYFNQYSDGNPNDVPNLFNATMISTYNQRRAPVRDLMQSGILNKITYPTGGFTEFIYESHSYSKFIKQIPISVQTMTKDSIAGGVRVKQINSQANFGSPVLTKKYYYTRNYLTGDTLSSGVLNSGQPLYIDEDDYSELATGSSTVQLLLHYHIFSSNNILPLHYTNGNHVTYTNVTEVNSDNSFTIYTFSNHDNGYLNKPAINAVATKYSYNEKAIFQNNSVELERGALLQQSAYSSSKVLLSNTVNQYNDNSTRFNDGTRRYMYLNKDIYDGKAMSGNPDNGPLPYVRKLVSIFAMSDYIHYPFLKSTIETRYDQYGTNPLTVVKYYTYDNYRNKKNEKTINSKNDTVSITINYPADSIVGLSAVAWLGKKSLLNAHQVNAALEIISTEKELPVVHTRTDYLNFENVNALILPFNALTAVNSNLLEVADQFLNYDKYGNVLTNMGRDGIPISYDWRYNQLRPVVKVLNAVNTFHYFKKQVQYVASNSLFWSAGQVNQQSTSFVHERAGDISLQVGFSSLPGTAIVNMNYTLSGAAGRTGVMCINGQGTSCPTTAYLTFSGMPAGNYTFTAYPATNASISNYVSCSYASSTTVQDSTGIREFFYEGFEEATGATVGTAHTGKKYFNTTYTVPYTPPNTRNYIIQWWSLSGGIWGLNEQPYTANKVLTGPVDDVRVYPVDAQMSSYTYQPSFGITSEIDTKGNTIYYEYDGLGRLKTMRDKDNKILKQFDYQYQQPLTQ